MMSMGCAFARDIGASQEPGRGWGSPRATVDHAAEKPDGLEPLASPSVLGPVIRYLALAFIFFQVATTAALATQVVLFAGDAAGALSSAEPASASLTPSISALVAETAGRPEARQMEHLLIQIDPGEQSQASPVND